MIYFVYFYYSKCFKPRETPLFFVFASFYIVSICIGEKTAADNTVHGEPPELKDS